MSNVVDRCCIAPQCDTIANPSKYDGYCFRCFILQNPDSPLVRNHKTKESAVVRRIMAEFPDVPWICDRPIPGGTSGKKPDMYADFGTFILIIEIDEHDHRGYSGETERLKLLFKDGGGAPLVVVRFNPDSYTNSSDGVRHASCWRADKKGLLAVRDEELWEGRLRVLCDAVCAKLHADPHALMDIDVTRLFHTERDEDDDEL
jgi:hypothetical protein